MTQVITRTAYISKQISHSQFFGYIAEKCNLPAFPEDFMQRVKRALENNDVHLNTIPLQEWDNMTFFFTRNTKAIISEYDNGYSLAAGVCVLKEKARLQAGKENVINLERRANVM